MAVVRRNILTNSSARDQYIKGLKLLKADTLGPTTGQFGIPGPDRKINTYDLFVVWHHVAMNTFTPPAQGDRNAAHRGPVFLPWHRYMLVLLERHLQRVLNDATFGLPYWDWAADGELPAAQQASSPLWKANCMGGQGNPVSTGPFGFNPASAGAWSVRLEVDPNGNLRQTNRGLRRQFATFAPTLPRKAHVQTAVGQTQYDRPNWNAASSGFRNRVEGWLPSGSAPNLHNRVHVWVGGDMLPSASPNDPVFYLNHCNEDRIWQAWIAARGQVYAPPQTASSSLLGHRIDDAMHSLIAPSTTPRDMLDVSDVYSYDTLTVF